MSKLSDFLSREKIDTRRLRVVSHRIESLRTEDHAIKNARRKAKEGGDKPEMATRKPRSGRPITPRQLTSALAGDTISGPTKSRVLRAVNHVLSVRKKDAVKLQDLF